MALPESKCPYFKAKGMHLYVPFAKLPGGEFCHGCGKERL